MLHEADVPVVAKRVAAWDEVYYGTLGFLAGLYPNPSAIFPESLLSHPRRTRLIVSPVGCLVCTYRADTPSFTSEWRSSDSISDIVTEFVPTGLPAEGFEAATELFTEFAQKLAVKGIKNLFLETTLDRNTPALNEVSDSLWEKVRLFQDIGANSWTLESARKAANSDILLATTRKLLRLTAGDKEPVTDTNSNRREVTTALETLIADFEFLLETASHEEQLQVFLKSHPELLDIRASRVDPKVKLGSEYVTDFIITLPGQSHVLVEIEPASHKLYTARHNPSAALSHAVQQVENWLEWVSDNIAYLRRERYPDIHEPKGLVVLGRRSTLDPKSAKALHRRNKLHAVRVVTYDDLLDDLRAVTKNLTHIA